MLGRKMEDAISYLDPKEKQILDSFDKIIIWGFPIHSHTHSYIHACWVKTFMALGKETYWFSDEKHESPDTFSYQNCLIITEGFQDTKLPIHPSNVYFVHFCIYPEKYLRAGARLFEIRFHVNEFHDCNSEWKLDDGTHTLVNLSEDVFYESLTTNAGISKEFRGETPKRMNYEAVYLTWPTDLLPWEINLKDAELPRENVIHFVGTFYKNERFLKFKEIAERNGIQYVHHDPWTKPVSFEENKKLIQESVLSFDFRPEGNAEEEARYGVLNGKNHLAIGYIPCRLYKSISYGHIPLTDSPHAAEHFGDAVVFEKDLEQLFIKGLEAQKDLDRKHRAMKFVQSRHTYLHRVRDLLRGLLQPRPSPLHPKFLPSTWSQITLVSSLINIQRVNHDGRDFSTYVEWFRQFLEIPAPMVLFVQPEIVELVESIRKDKPTKIIPQTFQSTPLSWSTPHIDRTQNSNEWKAVAKHPNDITNKSAPYVTLMHSKFAWVWNAVQDNPFNTDLFFWIDGGLTRFHPQLPYNLMEPHPRNIRALRKRKQLYCQAGGYKDKYFHEFMQGKRFAPDEILGSNENIIIGGFWGGHSSIVESLCEFSLRFYVKELLLKHRVDNDQPTLFFHFQEKPSEYNIIITNQNIEIPGFLQFLFGYIRE
jgi:hypothetical protein